MHDHIEEMGKNIVRRLHPDEPNRHSRLWIDEEIKDILANDLARINFICKGGENEHVFINYDTIFHVYCFLNI